MQGQIQPQFVADHVDCNDVFRRIDHAFRQANPTARSSRSAGVAVITACGQPLKVNAIAVSSATTRSPGHN